MLSKTGSSTTRTPVKHKTVVMIKDPKDDEFTIFDRELALRVYTWPHFGTYRGCQLKENHSNSERIGQEAPIVDVVMANESGTAKLPHFWTAPDSYFDTTLKHLDNNVNDIDMDTIVIAQRVLGV